MTQKSTREVLLLLIDDIELISKELVENLIGNKQQKTLNVELPVLVELMVQKNDDVKAALKLAEEQGTLRQKMLELESEVERQDQEIRQLQKQLKEAEQLLATAIFQAKQKLQSISKANRKPVSSEELIKFAHRISASNAICAPLTWQQGDLRRPYPTDIDMRLGFLGRIGDLNVNGHMNAHGVGSLSDMLHRPPHPQLSVPNSQAGTYSWLSQGDLHLPLSSHGSVSIEAKNVKRENDDVDVMSTDSSTSSSSDSQ
nr:EOG090X0DX5 [Eulimnadia texana]